MVGRFRFVPALLIFSCSDHTASAASLAGADTPNDHVHHRPKRSDDAPGGAGPSLSLPTWTVAATGSGTSYAQACDRESARYDTILSYGITPTDDDNAIATTWATTTSYTAETTRLCDGRVRAIGTLTPVQSGSVLTESVPMITYTGPGPSCSVSQSDCAWLRKSYLSAESSYSSSLSRFPDAPPGNSPTVPRCYIPGPPLEVCGQCTIHGGHVELLYFPVTTEISRNMCATAPTSSVICPYGPTYSNNDTVSGFNTAPCPYISTELPSTTDSGPSTVINGSTLFSNRAYIAYDTLYATNDCGFVGSTYSNGLVTVASSDVYSLSGYHFYMSKAAYSFNFADLMPPVPASAYLCQATCDDSGSPLSDGDMLNGKYGGALGFCSTIIDEVFKPRIAVPPQMRAIDPQWNNCLLGLDALYDPPRLMSSEATLDVPSATATSNAQPQQGASTAHTTASPTAAPDMATGHTDGSSDSSLAGSEQATSHEVDSSAPHTAMMESQTPTLVAADTQSDTTPTIDEAAPSGSNSASMEASDGGGSAAASGTSTGARLVLTMDPRATTLFVLVLSYMVW